MSGAFAVANPRRIKAAHRRRRKVASGPIVQRYYDPVIGRFLSVDPVTANGNTGGNFNRYWYANNNPYKFTDPDGRYVETVLDIGFIAADVADIASNGFNSTNTTSLIGNVVGALIPGATGLGKLAVAGAAVIKGADKATDAGKTGRAANKLAPDPKAAGAHSTLKRDADGNITNTATYNPNSKNPSGFQETKRVDVTGKAHTNPDGAVVPTPHVKEAGVKEVRPALPDEPPRK